MLTAMTDKEIQARDAKVKELYKSSTFQDGVLAILMDIKVGHFGLNEDIARDKARKIVDLALEFY